MASGCTFRRFDVKNRNRRAHCTDRLILCQLENEDPFKRSEVMMAEGSDPKVPKNNMRKYKWPLITYLILVLISLILAFSQSGPNSEFRGIWLILLGLPWSILLSLLLSVTSIPNHQTAIFILSGIIPVIVNSIIIYKASNRLLKT